MRDHDLAIDLYRKGSTKWVRTDRASYWWSLECVPPYDMAGGGFILGEPYTHDAKGRSVCAVFRCSGDPFSDSSRFSLRYLPVSLGKRALRGEPDIGADA